MQHLGDITKISGYHAPVVDCIIGGSPCQDLSVAGKRAGLEGERSGLFMEQIRIVKEMRQRDRENGRADELLRPRFMVWENVPGAFSSNGGKDFQAVLTEIARISEPEAPDVPLPDKGKWSKSGCIYDELGSWSIAWRVHDAQFWGVPQRRKRIALVADFGGLSAPEILFERKGLRGDFAQGGTPRQGAAADAESSTGTERSERKCYGISSYASNAMLSDNPHSGIYEAETSRTLELNGGNPACNQGGIAVVEPVTAYWDGSQVCGTLTANNAGGSQRMPDKENFNCVVEPLCIGNGQVNGAVNATKGIAHTLNCMHDPMAICYGVDAGNATEGIEITGGLQASAAHNLNSNNTIRPNNFVRRLTPLECERLQGFPDGWTDIGEWIDSKGKKHKEADSPRYKALGNSIALPPWKWGLKRLCACYERDATMASLFDGIGGFPLIWEQLNGKGSCLWASEIEEFPIAVTKLRFGGD